MQKPYWQYDGERPCFVDVNRIPEDHRQKQELEYFLLTLVNQKLWLNGSHWSEECVNQQVCRIGQHHNEAVEEDHQIQFRGGELDHDVEEGPLRLDCVRYDTHRQAYGEHRVNGQGS